MRIIQPTYNRRNLLGDGCMEPSDAARPRTQSPHLPGRSVSPTAAASRWRSTLGTDGTISPTELTPEYIETFRKMTRKRAEMGIAAPFETETGYLFASDLNTPRRFETLADMLLSRGHGEARVEKILGANLLRLFSATWGD